MPTRRSRTAARRSRWTARRKFRNACCFTVRDRLAAGAPIAHLSLALAGWLHYLRGHDEAGQTYAIDDPLAVALQALLRASDMLPDAQGRADRITRFAPVFGDLAGEPRLVAALAAPLQSLRERGVAAALAAAAPQSPRNPTTP